MPSPFPGMDPYLEHPALWPDWHNSLLISVADYITPKVAPRYFVALGRSTYLLEAGDNILGEPIPVNDEVGENFLEVREVTSGKLVTILELLSAVNKLHGKGRADYEEKRDQVFQSRTNLVEVDLLRAGEPMAVVGRPARSDYRILVSRGSRRPHAQLYTFNLRQPIPQFPLPLLPGDEEPPVEMNTILHAMYERARFDLRLDYSQPPVPPLAEADAAWAVTLIHEGHPGPPTSDA